MAWLEKLQPMSLHHLQSEARNRASKNCVIGAFPALNARPEPVLGDWLSQITTELVAFRQANPGAEVGLSRSIRSFTRPTIDSLPILIFAKSIKYPSSSQAAEAFLRRCAVRELHQPYVKWA
jgi:hypothetical protein